MSSNDSLMYSAVGLQELQPDCHILRCCVKCRVSGENPNEVELGRCLDKLFAGGKSQRKKELMPLK